MVWNKNGLLAALVVCGSCIVIAGMPDTGNWFIQKLTDKKGHYPRFDLQVSEGLVAWDESYLDQCNYYDGIGIYVFQYHGQFAHDVSVDKDVMVGSLYSGDGVIFRKNFGASLFDSGTSSFNNPDIFGSTVIWESNNNIYCGFDWGDFESRECLTDNDQCWHNGSMPRIAKDVVYWQSYDGYDYELFMLKNCEIQQLTYNEVDDSTSLMVSDNGHIAWVGDNQVYYYDGQRFHQMTLGEYGGRIWGISDSGLLFSSAERFDSGYEVAYLLYFDGHDFQCLYEKPGWWDWMDYPVVASLGGDSIAWMDLEKVYFYKNGRMISWNNKVDWLDSASIGVWGNRIVWRNDDGDLYFAEYLDSPICQTELKMDGNGDCVVNLEDFMIFASEWLKTGYNP